LQGKKEIEKMNNNGGEFGVGRGPIAREQKMVAFLAVEGREVFWVEPRGRKEGMLPVCQIYFERKRAVSVGHPRRSERERKRGKP